jgi:peptide/nickel transport system substrate-binding protein
MLLRRSGALCLLLVTVLLAAAACGGSGGGGGATSATGDASSSAAGTPRRGGSVAMLEEATFAGSWPAGLDPATNTNGGANLTQNQAIFGGRFLLRANDDGSDAKVAPNQAKRGTLSADAKTLTIELRPGIRFSDGTSFDAKAVIWNFQRDTDASCTCAPSWQLRKKEPFTSPDPLTVVVHLAEPDAALLHSFAALNVNWIASPDAFTKMGANKFKITPVGAGPFVVVSDQLSSKLVLKRNPTFFKKGLPYLDRLTFQSIGNEQAAYQAMVAGQGDGYEGMTQPPVIQQSQRSKLRATFQSSTAVWAVQFNTLHAPFDNKKAREAIYYATDWAAINKGLLNGKGNITQSFATPVDLYAHGPVAGYRTYDLARAKRLVKGLDGLSVHLDTLENYTVMEVLKALQSQWQKAGIEVSIKGYQLNTWIKHVGGGTWQAILGAVGAWDPAAGRGLRFPFGSHSPSSGVRDPHLDELLQRGRSTAGGAKRERIYRQIATYLSDHAYALFGLTPAPASVAVAGVHGPGLTTVIPALYIKTGIIWSEVWTGN